jgi:2-methylisocitrate lyase-like PEP mutase family enzyme
VRTQLREQAERLRELHHGAEPLVLANVWDVTSARVVAGVPGCRAIATSSAAVARSLGWEDGERIPPAEMLAAVVRIAAAVELPVTADLEAGYGDPAATAEAAIEAGAVGMNLEDRLRPIDEQVERIGEVIEAGRRAGVRLVLNARTDVFLDGSREVADAVERANAYLAAGADCAFVIGVADRETIARLAREVAGPLNVLVEPGSPRVAELAELGVRRISVGSRLHRASLAFVERAARGLLEGGRPELD